jgi:tyrosyl-tRNA synthetase
MEYCKYIIFPSHGTFTVTRSESNGGNSLYNNYEELENEYKEGKVYPADLKTSVALALNKLIEPVRLHFKNDPYAKRLLELVRSFQVTR